MGHSELGHLFATRAELNWVNEPMLVRIRFHVYVYEWGILLTLVLRADIASLSLEHQPCLLGSSGHHPKPMLSFWLTHKPY